MSTTFDPLALLRQNEEAKKKGGAKAGGFDPAALLKANESARNGPPLPIGFTTTGEPILGIGRNIPATIGAETRPYYTARLGGISPEDIAEALPNVLGTVASFGGAAKKTPVGLGLTAGAGLIGDLARQMIAAATGAPRWSVAAPLKEAGKQAGLEGAGRLIGGLTRALAAPPAAVTREVEKVAEEIGLPAPPEGWRKWAIENTLLGRYFARKGAKAGLREAGEAIGAEAEKLGIPAPPEELIAPGLKPKELAVAAKGIRKESAAAIKAEAAAVSTEALAALPGEKLRLMQEVRDTATREVEASIAALTEVLPPGETGAILQSATRGGAAVAKREAGVRYAKVDELAKDATTNIADWKARFAQFLEGEAPFADPGLNKLRAKVFGTVDAEGGKVGGLNDVVSYKEARELQKDLGDLLPFRELVSKAQKGPTKFLWEELTGQIELGLSSARPEALSAFRDANGFYRKFVNAARGGVMPALVKRDPEYFVKQIPVDGVTNARRLKQLILDYPLAHGEPGEKEAAKEAWAKLQGAYVKQRLLGDGIENLPTALGKYDPQVLETIFGSTQDGRRLLGNVSLVSKAIEEAGPKIEAQLAAEAERLKRVVSKTPASPERQAAIKRLGMIEAALTRSEAASGKLAPWWSVSVGLGGAGWMLGKAMPIAGLIGTVEGFGGYLGWALYHPEQAQRLAGAIKKTGDSLQVGAPALVRLIDEYRQRQLREEKRAKQFQYLDVPPMFIQPVPERTSPDGFPPPPR